MKKRTRSASRSRSRDRSESNSNKRHRSKTKKRKHSKDHKRRRSSSSSSTSSSSSSTSSSSSSRERKRKEKKRKKKRKKKKKAKQKEKSFKKSDIGAEIPSAIGPDLPDTVIPGPSKEDGEQSKARAKRPMTKEEWEKSQSVIRHVYDPETGRNRLVKGDGEILEEIVSKQRQKEINKQATRGDGMFFATKMGIQDR